MCPLFVCVPKLIDGKCVCACTGMCVSKALRVYPERSSAGTLQHADGLSSRLLKFIIFQYNFRFADKSKYLYVSQFLYSLSPIFLFINFLHSYGTFTVMCLDLSLLKSIFYSGSLFFSFFMF